MTSPDILMRIRVLWLIPLLVSSGWILADSAFSWETLPCTALAGNVFFALTQLGLLVWGLINKTHGAIVNNTFLSLAPVAWLYPWTLAPGAFPAALGPLLRLLAVGFMTRQVAASWKKTGLMFEPKGAWRL
jgi:hypothetical protein